MLYVQPDAKRVDGRTPPDVRSFSRGRMLLDLLFSAPIDHQPLLVGLQTTSSLFAGAEICCLFLDRHFSYRTIIDVYRTIEIGGFAGWVVSGMAPKLCI